MNYNVQLTFKNRLFLLDMICHQFPNPRNDLARFGMVGLDNIDPEAAFKN